LAVSAPHRLEDLDTPVAIVDLDAVERNITRLQSYCDEQGFALRPHVKTHKLPALAQKQVEAGAVGICCQKLGEAEVMAAAGLTDILLPYPIIGQTKVERLVALARDVRISVGADSETAARGLSAALGPAGLTIDFLVDCDTGYARTGVQSPREAADLGRLVDSLPGLRFAGLMTYPTTPAAVPVLREMREECERAGLEVRVVSGGGTPTAFQTHEFGGVTELRVGTYVYGDRACVGLGVMTPDDCALHVRATVVSRPTADRAIIDAGSKALTSDPVPWTGEPGFGLIRELPGAAIYALSEEHGHVDVSACARGPEIGETVTVLPNHACACVNLHNDVVAHRSGAVVGVWPVAARGRIQ
jgi:D-serine deaminase-like pyridoxal phosphate-dependent protein